MAQGIHQQINPAAPVALTLVDECPDTGNQLSRRIIIPRGKRKQDVRARKDIFLQLFVRNLGNIAICCRKMGIDRTAYYEWMKTDATFRQQIAEIEEVRLDFAEHALWARMKAGDTKAIIFYLKTKGKERGYVEKQDELIPVDHNNATVRSALDVVLSHLTPEQMKAITQEIEPDGGSSQEEGHA